MTGNRRCADPSLSGGRGALRKGIDPFARFPPWRRKRHLHHRQTSCFPDVSGRPGSRSRSGEQARSETRPALSNRPERALPLSYRSHARPGGIRTRDPVINDVTDLFTTGAALGCGERSRTERRLLTQGAFLLRRSCPNPRRNIPREDASTVRNRPTPPMGKLVWSEVSFLFTTAMASRGTNGAALFSTKNAAPSPPGTSKSPLFPLQELRWGRKQKPLRSIGSGGVRETELWNDLKPFRLRESARHCRRTGRSARTWSAPR
jgi:hypothetical protein